MKILSLIRDGRGRLHAELCVSPDLKRRELSVLTGSATLVWCGLAARSQRAPDVIAELRQAFGGASEDGTLACKPASAIRQLYWLTVIRPALRDGKGRAVRALHRALVAPVKKTLYRLAHLGRIT